jgi:hypothetical protein
MKTLSSPIKLIQDSVKIFFDKKNLPNFLKIYLPLLPFALFSLWQTTYFKGVDQLKDYRLLAVVVVLNLVYLVVFFWVSVSGFLSVKKIISNESVEFKKIYGESWKMLWKFSLVSILVFLAMLGGTILLIIPGIIFSVWFYFAKFVFVDRNLGVIESMKKSRSLVAGNFWQVLGRLIVFGVFTALAGFAVSVIPYGIGEALTSLLGAVFVLPAFLLYKELESI